MQPRGSHCRWCTCAPSPAASTPPPGPTTLSGTCARTPVRPRGVPAVFESQVCLPTTAQQPNPRVPFAQGTNRTDAPLRAAGTPRATLARCSATAASTPGSARHGVTSPAATMPSPTSRARAPSAARRAAASTCSLFPPLQSLSGYAYGPRRRPTPSGPPLSQRDLIQRPRPNPCTGTWHGTSGRTRRNAPSGARSAPTTRRRSTPPCSLTSSASTSAPVTTLAQLRTAHVSPITPLSTRLP